MANPEWTTQPERSNTLAMRFIVWVALTLGRPTARLLLYPICLYFLCFAWKAKAASRKYLGKVLGRKPRFTDLFRHIHTFASTILDRVFLLKDQCARFDVRVHGTEIVDDMAMHGEGCFLVGAHLGSFEIMRALGQEAQGLRISLVMYEENARKLNSVLAAINPNGFPRIIALGKVDSMLKIQDALKDGEFVGVLSDRTITGEGTITQQFLGEDAHFPLGPFRLAAMLRRPIVLMFGVYRGGNRYDVYFESLADMRDVDRSQRSAVVEATIQQYVSRLEYYCRLAPYNWFNFYDFWK
ncbi:MAG: acyl-CoA synthetase [Pseudomonadota bacterium]